MRILLLVYGIGRGVEICEKSIRDNVISPLKKFNSIDVVYVRKYNNAYPYRWYSDDVPFGGFHFAFEEGLYFPQKIFEFSLKFRDIHDDNFASNRNLLYQLSKIQIALNFKDLADYDRVIFCRDDIMFHEPLDWDLILSLSTCNAVISKWHWNAGMSERFVVTNVTYATLIGNRLNDVVESIKYFRTLNGEMLQYFIFDKYKIRTCALDIKFSRVRYNNEIINERFFLAFWQPIMVIRVLKCRVITIMKIFLLGIGWNIRF